MIVHTLISPYRLANNYLIEIESGKFIGIDIGNIDLSEITSIIELNNGVLLGYFLTHAHGDHTVGLQAMWDLHKMPIYCSKNTSLELNNPRKNFSIYAEEIPTFNYNLPFTIVEDDAVIFFEEKAFNIIETPGHSPGCIVVIHKKAVFTGDFIMKDFKTPLNLPNSSRVDYVVSREKFLQKIKGSEQTFYPGHGESFSSLKDIF
jgi:glyoxylase-like metal-dependent hydrolase (beta-lactamase superfamily II)